MLSSSTILTRLSRETHALHADADAPWLALPAADVRRSDYIHQLAITFGFEAPLDGASAYTHGFASVVGARCTAHAGLIAADLVALGMSTDELSALPTCFSTVPFEELAEALGWMYVVERSRLLHDSVRRNVLRYIPTARNATSYLAAGGSIAGARWQAFGASLDRYARTDALAELVLRGAQHAFRRWIDWVDVNQPRWRSTG